MQSTETRLLGSFPANREKYREFGDICPLAHMGDQNLVRFEAFALKFPASIIREYTFKNREFSLVNNELWAAALPPSFPSPQTRVRAARLLTL
jgi:hypothetical protein